MLKKIEELRKRPKHTRESVAFFTAVVFTSLVVVIWLVALPARFAETPEISINDESGGFSRAFADMKTQMGSLFNGFEESFEDLESDTVSAEVIESETASGIEMDFKEMFTASATDRKEVVKTTGTTTLESTSTVSTQDQGQPKIPRQILIGTTSSQNQPLE